MSSTNTNKNARDVVIVSAVRTPLTRARKGGLSKVPPSTLLSTAFKGVFDKIPIQPQPNIQGISPSDVQDICIGNVLSPTAAIIARMAQIQSGIPYTVPISTCNRQCSSGLQAVAHIANAIKSGQINIGLAGGFESMSTDQMHKQPMPDVDWNIMNSCKEAMDCIIPMGVTSENVAKKYNLKRYDLDEFAAESHGKAFNAQTHNKFVDEIVPVGNVSQDDGIRKGTTAEKLSKLKPVFDENGSTTAGNASQLTDGAAAVLLMTREEAIKRQLPILGVWRSFEVQGVPPNIMGIGPAVVIPPACAKANISVEDVDVFEINEAFATQASWCIQELNIPKEKVNPNGGAIALGHPLGATGARQIATLLHEMNRTGKRFGIVSMCIGTGAGAAAVLEVEPRKQSAL
ncbi:3-ketoacyl-coa thiolase [Chaetoceros tenuissimus]|uniref:acetyl-CoA C-acyltransferase n=1 Tax=Chaetoceros tenuissimus TaxID=426638 RepID=A0AAD3D249_9STRA|nr:3-ketoacyl-coa thiolase [Chaetoceros tenuissimus]